MTDPAFTSPAGELTGRRTTWTSALATELTDATCLWQDLDGLHVQPPPPTPPPTSTLWAWTRDGTLLRLRLDDHTVYLARWNGTGGHPTIPWKTTDARVTAYRDADNAHNQLGTAYLEITIHADHPHAVESPITFIKPHTSSHTATTSTQ